MSGAPSPLLGTKPCSKCGTVKALNEFSPDKNRTLGVGSQCKSCRGKNERERYWNRGGREKEAGWYDRNQNRKIRTSTEWYYKNQEAMKLYKNTWDTDERSGLLTRHNNPRSAFNTYPTGGV